MVYLKTTQEMFWGKVIHRKLSKTICVCLYSQFRIEKCLIWSEQIEQINKRSHKIDV